MSPAGAVRSAIAEALVASAGRLLSWEPRDREASGPEEVHAARTVIRRLRSDLGSFGPALRSGPTRPLRRELRWAGRVLSDVRDLDVVLEQVEEDAHSLPAELAPAGERVIDRLRSERHDSWMIALGHIAGPRWTKLRDDLRGLAEAPPFRSRPTLETADVMRPGWRRLRRAVAAAAADPSDAAFHRVRIAAKRVRYAAEALQPVVGRKAKVFSGCAEELQDAIGAHRDASAASAFLTRAAMIDDADEANVVRVLAGCSATSHGRAASDVPVAWQRVADRKNRFW